MPKPPVEQYLQTLPPADEIRRKLEANAAERHLLRELLKLAEKHDIAETSKTETPPCP